MASGLGITEDARRAGSVAPLRTSSNQGLLILRAAPAELRPSAKHGVRFLGITEDARGAGTVAPLPASSYVPCAYETRVS